MKYYAYLITYAVKKVSGETIENDMNVYSRGKMNIEDIDYFKKSILNHEKDVYVKSIIIKNIFCFGKVKKDKHKDKKE